MSSSSAALQLTLTDAETDKAGVWTLWPVGAVVHRDPLDPTLQVTEPERTVRRVRLGDNYSVELILKRTPTYHEVECHRKLWRAGLPVPTLVAYHHGTPGWLLMERAACTLLDDINVVDNDTQVRALFAAVRKVVRALRDDGLVHGDLFPHNVLFDASATQFWLSDFGASSPTPRERGRVSSMHANTVSLPVGSVKRPAAPPNRPLSRGVVPEVGQQLHELAQHIARYAQRWETKDRVMPLNPTLLDAPTMMQLIARDGSAEPDTRPAKRPRLFEVPCRLCWTLTTLRCAACLPQRQEFAVAYCSKVCQQEDWAEHVSACVHAAQ